jgi:glyoxylase-like metal-dependent hydrolase (beta-lactamase superfamily II)
VDDVAPLSLGSDVHLIDTRMGGFDGITAAYLIRSERPVLVETGAALSADRVVASLAALGIGPTDLATIVVTHIHLDHAGGVGDLSVAFPDAEVVVHERGARHLVSPERLLSSARRVYGDVMDSVFGELLPTPAERVRALGDVGEIDLGGGRRLSSHWSPGHASHHVGLLDSETGDLYVGDAAGIYVPEVDLVKPATPPPDFDLQVALASIEVFRALRPQRLMFSHYGPVTEIDETLDASVEELELWVELTRDVRRQGLDLDHAVAAVRDRTRERYAAIEADPELRAKHDLLNSDEANLTGILRWLDQAEPVTA